MTEGGMTGHRAPMPDVFGLTQELVDIASESFAEGPLVDHIESELRSLAHLDVARVGDNLVARTDLGRDLRLVLGGHTDTVPANDNFPSRLDGNVLWGVGSADMKAGLAVMLASARHHTAPAVDLTYVFYAREEVASSHSGLGELFRERPDLLVGDVAFLGEPTDGAIEAGCQGSVRVRATFAGRRAHTARAWMGENAVHRLAPVLTALASYEPRQPVISGCRFHEALLAVSVDGGVAGNVVPDSASLTIVHRFAPDHTSAEAEGVVREFLAPFIGDGDTVEVLDVASAAAPAVGHPLVAHLIERNGLGVTAKLGWTDVARFAEVGIPAINFGPGDPTIAHTAGEHVTRDSVERTWRAFDDLVTGGVPGR